MRLRLAHLVLATLLFGLSTGAALGVLAWKRANGLAGEAKLAALRAQDHHSEALDGRPHMLVVDYTRPSFVKRGHLVHATDGVVASFLVAHGQDSGWARVSQVGDRPTSRQSSRGAFRAGPVRDGPHGPELPIVGLDPLLNGNAEDRGLAIHGSAQVSWASIWDNGGRLVRSEGAPMLHHEVMRDVVDLLGDGGLIYVHWEPHRGGPDRTPRSAGKGR